MTDSAIRAGQDWTSSVKTGTRKIALLGYLAVAVFIGGFGIWAATVPLAGAAIVSGIVAAAGNNQIVQHLEGGILQEVHVHEGERVTAGEPLFTMDPTRAQSSLNALTKQWIGLRARKERLEAQRDGKAALEFDSELVALAEKHGLDHVLEEQRDEFAARLARYNSEIVILKQRVGAGTEGISGYDSQKKALEEQLAVVSEETRRKETLLDQGLVNRSEYTALLRAQAELVGQIGSIASQIEQTKSQIVEAREQLVRQETQRVEQSLSDLSDVSAKMGNLEEQMNAAQDVLDRTEVRAPSDGVVIRIFQNTPGSVIQPAGELAQLLPTNSELIVEGRIRPTDIDIVRPGQKAELRFVALNSRSTPQVSGTVSYISPDRLVDAASGQSYYVARLRITDDLPPEINREQIYPGMPVEAMISTGDRTFLEYLAKPLTDSFTRAFRED